MVNKIFPDAYKECNEFMRHKTFLINPSIILSKKIKIHKVLQNPGEFIITLGKCYHAGFNMGYNCAEAVNFANRNWINYGFKANFCNCRKDSVRIDMNYFMKNLIKRKKLNFNEKKVLLSNKILEKEDTITRRKISKKKNEVEDVLLKKKTKRGIGVERRKK